MPGAIERAALRLAAPLLPRKWSETVRLIATDPRPTPDGSVAVEIDLGQLLLPQPRERIPDHSALAGGMEAWRAEWAAARFADPKRKAIKPRRLTELQDGVAEAIRRLRMAGLPADHP